MATLLGDQNGVFGISEDGEQTGFLLDGSSQTYEQDEKTVKNISGDDTGIAMYNERMQFTLSGFIPATSPFNGKIASVIALQTAPANHLQEAMNVGTYIAKNITTTQAAEEFQRIELTGTYHPFVVP